ncbi:MAG: hypothetical protein J6D31_02640 [Clostridia bacterium]|nr:hypothetical protein [Clostridia bacterium]
MYESKKVLLIAGGGTLGTYTGRELLRLGCYVDVVCPEEKVADHERLRFVQGYATEELLSSLFAENHYDGIVNFLHYQDPEEYKKAYGLLIKNTDHLIFLSSYRVYANEMHPVTEEAPRLHEVYADNAWLMEHDRYGVSKAICEDFLFREHVGEHWTIVRPVISFSQYRLDLLLHSGDEVLRYAESGKPLPLPLAAKGLHAGLDWAGNSGKLIANLLFKPAAIGEAFSIYSGHGMTWGEVAEAYCKVIGLQVEWVDEETYFASSETARSKREIMWRYDRAFDRDLDSSKVMRVSGLTPADFATVEQGIRTEVALFKR